MVDHFFQILVLISAIFTDGVAKIIHLVYNFFPTTLYRGVIREKDVSLVIRTHVSRVALPTELQRRGSYGRPS